MTSQATDVRLAIPTSESLETFSGDVSNDVSNEMPRVRHINRQSDQAYICVTCSTLPMDKETRLMNRPTFNIPPNLVSRGVIIRQLVVDGMPCCIVLVTFGSYEKVGDESKYQPSPEVRFGSVWLYSPSKQPVQIPGHIDARVYYKNEAFDSYAFVSNVLTTYNAGKHSLIQGPMFKSMQQSQQQGVQPFEIQTGPMQYLSHVPVQYPGPNQWGQQVPHQWVPHGPNQWGQQVPHQWVPHGPNQWGQQVPHQWGQHGPNQWVPHGPNQWVPHGPNQSGQQPYKTQ